MNHNLYSFWAKTSPEGITYHPLLFHMLDVAAVAKQVWDYVFTDALKRRLSSALGGEADKLLVFLAGAHDIGKAIPAFQKRAQHWRSGTLRTSPNDKDVHHWKVSARALSGFLGEGDLSKILGQIVGGHHGVFPRSDELICLGQDSLGDKQWESARSRLLEEFARTIGFDRSEVQVSEVSDPFVVPVLSGCISVVDWVGSNQDFFPFACDNKEAPTEDAAEYWKRAQIRAGVALTTLGWLPPVKFAEEARFNQVFPDLAANVLQVAAAGLAETQYAPYMMIIEAPMGLGKTEAALYAADLAMCRGFARGMYVAMPTQAMSNAMFERVLNNYLRNRRHTGKLNLQLVHGDALLALPADVREGEVSEFKVNVETEGKEADLEAQSWFTARKRPLLAPFGVGTIDQSLLSVLQTRHWFVRMFGLAGKVVIFDEVHAYDAYMSTILERLLQWLAELDCTVILLSATLPDSKRRALLKAYSGSDTVEEKHYPRISLAAPARHPVAATEPARCVEIAVEKTLTLRLDFIDDRKETISAVLREKLVYGGCAAVVCNTVDRAIEVFRHLQESLEGTECMLFHARTLKKWRREREGEVLKKFGKGDKQEDGTYLNGNRPERAVLVATQVIEQSLDLDFDLMISEIAPIDLLLQRSGRLHRHTRPRPEGLKTPQFIVMCDADTSGSPPDTFGGGIEYVYERYILLKTWLTIREKNRLEVPTEVEALINAVYGTVDESPPDWSQHLDKAREKMENENSESGKAARCLLVSQPYHPSELIEQFNPQLVEDEDPEVHKSVRAATRESDPSITVVMLPKEQRIPIEPTTEEVRCLLDRSARISHGGIYNALRNKPEKWPEKWPKNAHLRYARLLRLDQANSAQVGNYRLIVDEQLGIVIEKENALNV